MPTIPGPKIYMNLQSKTSVSDSMGGFTDTWTTIAALKGVFIVPRLQERNVERLSDDKMTTFGYYHFICYIPEGVTVNETCRLEYSGRYFEIILVRNPGFINHHLEIELKEIR